MGHIINPISFRLGVTNFWRFNYVNVFNNSYYFKYFLFNNER